ncbi:MAG: zinc ABC transporter substrate-binding protein [Proteobacteria bacterium]|nr:zinc ABC transporter substrate-binding protein [Pseudomonadota bacterium]MBU4130542.1 zinc ABC transporter substrate-binding protein [Pseudomonadota bacterium]
MNFRNVLLIIIFFLALLPVTAFAKHPILVFVSILPQKYFVERIAGDAAVVNVLVKPGKSPATYSPTPDQIKDLTSSDIYFRIGVPFENGILHKIMEISEKIQIVDTRKGILLRTMTSHDHEDQDHEDHGPKTGEQDHTGKDPHIWMSPLLVIEQAKTMAAALISADPDSKTFYEQNLTAFIKDLDALHKRLETRLAPFKGENIFVFHPVFGYFTDAYGLNQVAIETMGKAPRGKELSAIIKKVKSEKTRIIFVQPQFDRNAAHKIAAAIKGSVVSIDPLAFDYLSNMDAIARILESSLAH